MVEWSLRNAVAPIALLSVAALGYAFVLVFGVPGGIYEGTTVLAGLFGVLALAAAGVREWISAGTAALALIGFSGGSDLAVALVIVGLVGFLLSTSYAATRRAIAP